MIRVGLIGAGWITTAHAEGWVAARGRAEVVAVADVDGAAAAELAGRFGAKVYLDYREMLDQAGIDAVDVCIPPHLHVEVVQAAASRRIHVLCEKPLARDLEEADTIAGAIEAAGITYVPAHNTVFYPSVVRARRYVAQADLGSLLFVRSWHCNAGPGPTRFGVGAVSELRPDDTWRSSRSLLGGGTVMDGGYHAVYRLLHLVQKPIATVTALLGRFRPDLGWETEDTALIIVRFEDGPLGEILISKAFDPPTTGRERLFTIVGQEGALSGNEAELELRLSKWDTPSVQRLSALQGNDAWLETFRSEIEHFLDVLEGRAMQIQTFKDARRTLQLIRDAYASAELSRPVSTDATHAGLSPAGRS